MIRPNHIKITYDISTQSGIFLDIEFFKSTRLLLEGKLDTRVYQKPGNQYLYIPQFSFHNPSVFKAMIKSEIRRYHILCSNSQDLNNIKELFFHRLIARGYNSNYLTNIFESINYSNRNYLIAKYLLKQNKKEEYDNIFQPLIISLPISARTMSLRLGRILANTTDDAIFDNNYYAMFGYDPPRIITCYKRAENLGEMLRSSTYKYAISQL